MNIQITPTVTVRSRVVVSDTKLVKAKRKCVLDLSLPKVVTKSTEGGTPKVEDRKISPEKLILQKNAFSTPRKRKLEGNEFSEVKRFRDYDERMIPMYRDFQLLGDSQFVRFAEKLLDMKVDRTESLRRIGYCVSGQKIADLYNRLMENKFGLHTNVIVLIGTNDIVYRTDYSLMCSSYQRMLDFLKTKCSKIILLTVPPVPKLEKFKLHWITLQKFNKFIFQFEDDQVGVVDLCSIFISYCNTVSTEYYEKMYFAPTRPDLVHLNEKGFKVLKFLLDLYLFENRLHLPRRQLF